MNAQLMQKQGTLPQTAGDVPIHYDGNSRTKPHLKGRSIVLPGRFNQKDKLFPLMRGKQFLFYQRTSRRTQPHVWFAGLDETYPFVSELESRSWRNFKGFGEEAFYRSLKPRGLRGLEARLHAKAGRQGDWWFLSLPYSWDELKKAHRITQGTELQAKKVTRKWMSRTNHRLTGILFEPEYGFGIAGTMTWGGFIVEGLLEASHHAARTLKGPHFLVQRGHD